MEYRAAGPDDIDLVMRTRLDTLIAVNGLENDHLFDHDFLEAARKFFLEGDQETVLAFAGARAVGCATMCYIRLMPTFSHPTGQRAHLMNVYTDRTWRRKGIAFHVVSILIRRAWERGATEISLDATEEGKKLYRKLGFTESCESMTLGSGRMDDHENQLQNREEME
ncbi:MAG: GNAT family N-acetyltransferase [Clostridia bacterium]|nr:GNAT family N-acetyltransferase [Clostridia bacterium]